MRHTISVPVCNAIRRRFQTWIVLWPFMTVVAGCYQTMVDQPKYKPYDATPFFADGQSSRPLVPGTVPREMVAGLPQLVTTPGAWRARGPGLGTGTTPAVLEITPPPMTKEWLERGRVQYDAYCVPCHGLLGDARGMIVARGFPSPPSYHTDRLRQMPSSYFVRVITEGYGLMYSYANRVQPVDRWAIAYYIQALQLSQDATLEEVPPETRHQLMEGTL